MAIHPTNRQFPRPTGPIIEWLLDSDPAIRWQVMRDLIGKASKVSLAGCLPSNYPMAAGTVKPRLARRGRPSTQDSDGRWPLDIQYPGDMPVEINEGEGRPSRWNTLRVLRVLTWCSFIQ